MAVEELDTEQFLDEVKKYPELWDIARKEYTKSNKAQTWLKICEVFNEDFDKKSEEEKQLISKRYMNRWKNIRDNYTRTQKKHRLGKTTRPYIYARHLQFLRDKPITERRRRSTSEGNPKSIRIKIAKSATLKARKLSPEKAPIKRRRKEAAERDAPESVGPSNAAPPQYEFEDDKAFFDSLIPTIKTFNIEQKLDLRSEVLTLVKKMRLSMMNQSLLNKSEFS